jgi:hypothetical protein
VVVAIRVGREDLLPEAVAPVVRIQKSLSREQRLLSLLVVVEVAVGLVAPVVVAEVQLILLLVLQMVSTVRQGKQELELLEQLLVVQVDLLVAVDRSAVQEVRFRVVPVVQVLQVVVAVAVADILVVVAVAATTTQVEVTVAVAVADQTFTAPQLSLV